MDKDFTLYEEALELNQLGFDEPCLAFYNGKFLDSTQYDFDNCSMMDIGQCLLAPTYSQAFRWFREKYGLDSKVEREIEGFYIGFYWTGVTWVQVGEGTYEEAELACLKQLIKILKNK